MHARLALDAICHCLQCAAMYNSSLLWEIQSRHHTVQYPRAAFTKGEEPIEEPIFALLWWVHNALSVAQALKFAKEAVEGFEQSTAASREAALDATRQAADFSQLAHKLMRAVYKAK